MRFAFTSQKEGNLGLHVGDNPLHVKHRREQLCVALNVERLFFMNQIHSDSVRVMDALSENEPSCDAMISCTKGIALAVMVADCVPLILYDEPTQSIGVVHAGRAGSALHVSSKTVHAMQKHFGVLPQNVRVWIGPCIQSCCYEVGKEVTQGLESSLHVRKGRYFLDLVSANKKELEEAGVLSEHIVLPTQCTCCGEGYFSYRKQKQTGRFAGVICL